MKSLVSLVVIPCLFLNFSFAQDLELELLASGFNDPVSIKHAGDNRLFIVEKEGVIRIINEDGSIQSAPFLDINDRVINSGNERGLLGLAFHPNYNINGYFYVNYINNSGNTVISRFTMDFPNPGSAEPNTELIILTYNQPFSNHNGGDLAFGLDNYLYISSGDGGSGGDPQNNSQNTTNLLGNILRVDVDNTSPPLNYSIPADNPFATSTADRQEIWAYGLRNPWRFSFDSSNGDLWIADVGQNNYEEINRASGSEAGLNYGWRCYEASTIYDNSGCPSSNTLTFPVAEYSHSGNGLFKCSITGGYVYRGNSYPNFQGLYFFADYCSSEIGYLNYNSTTDSWDMTLEEFVGNWTTFGEDMDKELYVASDQGNIYKIIDNDALSIDNPELSTISIYPNPTKEELNIDFKNYNSEIYIELAIYNIQGKVVKSIQRRSETIQTINTSDLSKGFYVLRINANNGEQSTHKLVVN